MIYGYARVSAKAQLKGNSLEEQRAELLRNGCNVIIEEQFTGKTTARPKFDDLIKNRIQKGDTLIVTKLDRFARNVTEGIATIKHLFNKGARIHVLNVGLLENTAMGNFFITTLLAVAELERCMILERTASGKEIARMRSGYKEGRPPIPKRTIALLTEYKQDCEEFLKKRNAQIRKVFCSSSAAILKKALSAMHTEAGCGHDCER